MGNLPTAILPSLILPVEHYVSELPEVDRPLKNLGSTRFFKVVRGRHAEGPVVVKVLVKHDPNLALKHHQEQLSLIRDILGPIPNLLPFSIWRDSDRAAFLIRPFVRYSLSERMFSLPSLEPLEKRWIVFQLLTALSSCHELGICHGDIKAENVLLTGWNWVQLTDFASFKPACLPPDNPATFSFFFDTSRRSCCYVAPERFTDSREVQELSPRMDIFSLGCLIAELFTNGQVIFDLPRLLDYASGKSSPDSTLELISDKEIQSLVRHMINVSPAHRHTASKYLDLCRGKVLPECFYSYLHHFLTSFSASVDPPHLRIRQLHRDIDQVLEALTRDSDRRLKDSPLLILPCVTCFIHTSRFRQARLQTLELLRLISDNLSDPPILERVVPYIIYFLREDKSTAGSNTALLTGEEPEVRALAIEILSHCVCKARQVPNNELELFPRYILPALKPLTRDSNILVQCSLSRSIGTLAETSLRFLELSQLASSKRAMRSNSTPASYDEEWKELRESIQQLVVHLLSSPQHEVRKTLLLHSLPQLCIFFGQHLANEIILSHMITFLNDKRDWQMRAAFFQHIPSVAAFVGISCLSMIYPLIYMGLADYEEAVCCRAVDALSALTELGLMRPQELTKVLQHATPLLVHPNLWIRHAAVGFIVSLVSCLDLVDTQCKLLPVLRPYLKAPGMGQTFGLSSLDALVLYESLRSPISRDLFNTALSLPGAPKLLLEREAGRLPGAVRPAPSGTDLGIMNKLRSMGMGEEVEGLLHACLPKGRTPKSQQESVTNRYIKLDDLTQVHKEQLNHNTKTPPLDRKEARRSTLLPGRRVRPNPEYELASVLSYGWTQQTARESAEQTLCRAPGEEAGLDTGDGKRQHRAVCAAELHSLLEFRRNRYIKDVEKKPAFHLQGTVVEDLAALDQFGAPRTEKRGWRPQGQLVAHFHEHGSAVNRIAVSEQQNYFVTCSDDGFVKLWNMDRIEGRKLGCKARKTIPLNAGRIKTIKFCRDNVLVGATEDGSIVLVRPLEQGSNNSIVYKRQLDVWQCGSVVEVTPFCYHSGELLVYATEHGTLCGLDARSNVPVWQVQNKQKLGLITALAADHGHSWLTVGTSLGAYVCWDIRFLLPVNEWKHPPSPNTPKNVYKTIYRMQPHPILSNYMLAAFNINNEVAVWELETAAVTQKLWAGVGSDLAGKMSPSQHSVRAILPFLSDDTPLVLTAGTDQCIRVWDLVSASRSERIVEAADTEYLKREIKFNEVFKNDITIFQEETSPPRVIHKGTESRQKLDSPPNGHQDTITDLAMVRTTPSRDTVSQNFIVSVSRDGVMKVWK